MRYNTTTMKRLLVLFFLGYLRFFTKLQLQKIHPIVIGVAGSSGKSSLVSLLKSVLSASYAVKTSEGKNSETGIPLSILGISMKSYGPVDWLKVAFLAPLSVLTKWEKCDIYIAEMGIDSPVEPKNMSYLLKIVTPKIGMVTNVGVEHSVYFDPFVSTTSDEERQKQILALTAKEETFLLRRIPKNGTAIVNMDDEAIAKVQNRIQASQMTISLQNKKADLVVKKIDVSIKEFRMEILWKDKSYFLTIPQFLPVFYAYEFLFALATAMQLDIPLSDAIAALEKSFALPPGRLSIFEGVKGTTLIDSSYNNATPEPILGILQILRRIQTPRQRKIAIIGDMRELGSQSKIEHEKVAHALSQSVDMVILIGPLMHNYAAPILKRLKVPYFSFIRFTDAKETILQEIREKDIILVKSSQNTLFLERVVEMLLADKANVAKLCRRGKFWDEQRAKSV